MRISAITPAGRTTPAIEALTNGPGLMVRGGRHKAAQIEGGCQKNVVHHDPFHARDLDRGSAQRRKVMRLALRMRNCWPTLKSRLLHRTSVVQMPLPSSGIDHSPFQQ